MEILLRTQPLSCWVANGLYSLNGRCYLALQIESISLCHGFIQKLIIDEFANQFWGRIRYFYAHRFDGFRFNIGTLISSKQQTAPQGDVIEIQARVVGAEDTAIPTITFDATGSTADVDLVEWRGSVKEGATGRFKHDERDVQVLIPQTRQPLIFLHEKRPEFKTHAYMFNGEKLDKCLKRALKLAQRRSTED